MLSKSDELLIFLTSVEQQDFEEQWHEDFFVISQILTEKA